MPFTLEEFEKKHGDKTTIEKLEKPQDTISSNQIGGFTLDEFDAIQKDRPPPFSVKETKDTEKDQLGGFTLDEFEREEEIRILDLSSGDYGTMREPTFMEKHPVLKDMYESVSNIPSFAISGIQQLGSGLGKALRFIDEPREKYLQEMYKKLGKEDKAKAGTFLAELGRGMEAYYDAKLQERAEEKPLEQEMEFSDRPFTKFSKTIINTLPQMALMLLPKVGLASLSAISAGDAYDEALEKTSDQSKANLAGVLNFLWTAFTEKLPFDELAKTGGGIKKALRVGGAEAFQEVTEHIGSHAIAKNVFDPERPDIKGEELLESAVGGFGGGFMSGGVRGFTDKGKTKWTELSKEKTKIQEQEVQPEEVQEKEARKKSPEQIRAEATEKRSKAKIGIAQKKIKNIQEARKEAERLQKGKLRDYQIKDFEESIKLQEEKIQQYLREEEVTREDIRKAEDKYLYKNVYSDIKDFGKISTKNVPPDLSTKAKNLIAKGDDTGRGADELMQYLSDRGYDIPQDVLEGETNPEDYLYDLLSAEKLELPQRGVDPDEILYGAEKIVSKEYKKKLKDVKENILNLKGVSLLHKKDMLDFVSKFKNRESLQDFLDFALSDQEIIKNPKIYAKAISDFNKKIKSFKQGEKFGVSKFKTQYFNPLVRVAKKAEFKLAVKKMKSKVSKINFRNLSHFYHKQIRESLAKFKSISASQKNFDDLKEAYENLQMNLYEARNEKKFLNEAMKQNFDQAVDKGVESITKSKGIDTTPSFEKKFGKKGIAQKTKEFIKKPSWYWVKQMRPELMVNMLDGFKQGHNTKVIFDSMVDAENQELRSFEKQFKVIESIHKDIISAKNIYKKITVGGKKINKSQAMHIYAHSFNDKSLQVLTNSGITQKMINEVKEQLSDKEKMAVRQMFDFYDKQHARVNKTHVELYGFDMGKEENYFPIHNLEDVDQDELIKMAPTQMMEILSGKPAPASGFKIARVKHKKGFAEFDYFQSIYRNLRNIEHFIAFGTTIRDVNKYLNNTKIKKAIEQEYGKGFHRTLNKWVRDIAYGGDKQVNDKFQKAAKFIRTNYATAVLGYNLTTVIKQPVSFLQGMKEIGVKETLSGMVDFYRKGLFGSMKFVDSKSAMMKNRSKTIENEIYDILQKGDKFITKTAIQKFKEYGMKPIQAADKTTTTILWLSKYNALIEQGKTDAEAIKEADRIIRRTQPMGGVIHLPDVLRGNEIVKLFMLFRNQLNQNANITYEAYQKLGEKGGLKNFIQTGAISLVLPAILIGMINRKFEMPEEPEELLYDVLNSTFGGLFLLGDVINYSTRKLSGKYAELRFGINLPIEEIMKGLFSKKTKTKKKHIGRGLAQLTGVPYVQLERLFKGETIKEKLIGKEYSKKKKKRKYYL